MRKVIVFVLFLVMVVAALPTATPASACEPCEPKTPGYWKNHPEAWPPQDAATPEQLALLDSPVQGDKWITMYKAVRAAELSMQVGDCSGCRKALEALWKAQYFLRNAERPVKANSDWWLMYEQYYWTLDAFNNGYLCN